jgi:decaprenylphospho-beta-D-ribofuranose 2-oxidase
MHKSLASLDRQTRIVAPYREIADRDALLELETPGRWIPRGAGVSYTALGFCQGVETLATEPLRKVLSFDPEARQIEVEAGISLGDLFEITAPHGLYLPVQPGHPQITVGGSIACDVHGKNPARDGLFHEQVHSLDLFHPQHGIRKLSADTDADLFELTCGGYGLTGVIVSAVLDLAPMPSPRLEIRRVPVGSLDDMLARMLELEDGYDYLYGWSDLSRFDDGLGRGYLSIATFDRTAAGQFPVLSRRFLRLDPDNEWRPRVRLINKLSARAVAGLHYALNGTAKTFAADLWNVLYPGAQQGFYFDLYGGVGFFGHMVLIPEDSSREYLADFQRILRRHGVPLVLAAVKRFDGAGKMLRFDGRGFSLHIHIPNTGGGRRLIADLEALAVESGAIRTPYFDAHLDAADARRQYAELEEFSSRIRVADSSRSFDSPLSRRLEL